MFQHAKVFQPLIWKTHRRREQFEECPHCGKPLRWIYDGIVWHPCDKEPVLFMMHPEGRCEIMYRRELLGNCLIYRVGDKRFVGAVPLYGSVPHYYTCDILREHRREFARKCGR